MKHRDLKQNSTHVKMNHNLYSVLMILTVTANPPLTRNYQELLDVSPPDRMARRDWS